MEGCGRDKALNEPAASRFGHVSVSVTETGPNEAFGYPEPPMSKVCAICGKKPGFGHHRSHSMVATNRRFNPNLQRVRMLLDGKPTRAYVCTRCLKAGKVQKAL